jgi:hypothetical protein
VVRFVAAAFFLSTGYWLLVTGYWLLVTLGATEHVADEQARPYQSPFTFHFSPLPSLPHSVNERARGQHDNQDGSFGSDLPIR